MYDDILNLVAKYGLNLLLEIWKILHNNIYLSLFLLRTNFLHKIINQKFQIRLCQDIFKSNIGDSYV